MFFAIRLQPFLRARRRHHDSAQPSEKVEGSSSGVRQQTSEFEAAQQKRERLLRWSEVLPEELQVLLRCSRFPRPARALWREIEEATAEESISQRHIS
jgi:hypothetical protein